MKNQRKNERLDCSVFVESKQGSAFDDTKTIDFSRGGIGFLSRNEVPLDKEIAIEIDLGENEDPVFVVGKVQWVRPDPDTDQFRVGMSFNDVLRGSKARLKQYFTNK